MTGRMAFSSAGPIPREPAFPVAEYAARIGRVRERMTQRYLDALLLFAPHSVNYLSGMDSENWVDFQCLILPADQDPTLVILDFELARSENSAVMNDVRTYGPDDDPIEVLLSILSELNLDAGNLGVEQTAGISVRQFRQLATGLNGRAQDSFGVVEDVRLVKSPLEIEYMRRAAALTDAGVQAGFDTIASGVPDYEVAAAITSALYGGGSDTVCWGPVVAAGFRAGAAHSTFAGHRIAMGETVFLELTGEVRRYTAPLMRTAVVGEPSAELRRIEESVQSTLGTVMRTARAGVVAAEVARAAQEALRPAIDQQMVFHYNFGYPVGLGYPPTWLEQLGFSLRTDNPRLLESGMTFHIPLSLRRYGAFACNLSQTIVVGEEGAQPLSTRPPALHVVSG